MDVKSSLVVVLTLFLAACSSTSHAAARPRTATVPSTVQTTTTNTTPANVTEAALVGSWRPVFIAGYHGPLTDPPLGVAPALSFDGRGHWGGTDGCNGMNGSYRLARNGAFQLVVGGMTQAACDGFPPTPASLRSAVRVELRGGRLTFFARNGDDIAQYGRANVTARVVLPSMTMTAGSSMSGHVLVENNTGQALHPIGCTSLFYVFLSNASIKPLPFFPQCAQVFTIPVGQSTYPIGVDATYLECAGPLGSGRRCLERNGRSVMPPLPPGQYQATLWGNIVPTPPPIAVRVTP